MAKVVGDIAVRVGADVSPLQKQMNRGKKSMRDFEKSSAEMAVNVAKAGAVMVTAIAGVAAGILKMASEAAAAGLEIKNLAQVANTSTTNFQKMAEASRTVGIEQTKLSDILKDVNDKVGDFLVTGGGPMADFFEHIAPKVGVTADQFARLSGPEALQLYVSSLEKAGVSQQQMTFYMEAIASDATALIPLLRDNGREMARLGDEAERAGRILNDDMIAAAQDLDRELNELTSTLRTNATKAVLEHKDEIILLIDFITDTLIPAVAKMAETLSTVALGWRAIGQAAQDAIGPLTRAAGLSEELNRPASANAANDAVTADDQARANAMGGGDVSGTGTRNFDPFSSAADQPMGGAGVQDIPGITSPAGVYSGRGIAAGPTPDEALEAAVAARREQLEAVEEVEREHSGRIAEIREQSAEEIAAIEARAAAERFNDIRGAFGDLSSLMNAENKKLFKIGQAAAIAEATVSGYKSAVSAWEKGMSIGGPPVAGAFTAASLAKTGMLISQISSASSSGGGGGGGGGSAGIGGGGASGGGGGAQEQQPTTTFAFTLQNDPMGFGESFARQMIEQLNATQRNGGRVQGVINNA